MRDVFGPRPSELAVVVFAVVALLAVGCDGTDAGFDDTGSPSSAGDGGEPFVNTEPVVDNEPVPAPMPDFCCGPIYLIGAPDRTVSRYDWSSFTISVFHQFSEDQLYATDHISKSTDGSKLLITSYQDFYTNRKEGRRPFWIIDLNNGALESVA